VRDSAQVSNTPEQYARLKEDERRRTLAGLLAELRFARECHAEWYRWVVDGMPRLTVEQYEAVKAKRAKRRQSA
jgi:hypothetical protein